MTTHIMSKLRRPLAVLGVALLFLTNSRFARPDIFWTSTVEDTLWQAEGDGSNPRALAGPPTGRGLMDFAIDPHAGYIYVANTLGRIERMNLDGTNLITLIDGLATSTEITVDPFHGYIFFSQSAVAQGTSGLYRSNLDGSEVVRMRSETPIDLAVDILHSTLFATSFAGVSAMDLDGQNRRTIYSCNGDCGEKQGAPTIWLGVAVDPIHEKVYWGEGFYVRRANLDGSDVEVFVSASTPGNTGDAFFVQEVAVDPIGGYVYWGNGEAPNLGNAKIGRARLDGSEVIGSLTNGSDYMEGLGVDVLIIPEPPTALFALAAATLASLAASRRRRTRRLEK